MDRAALPGWLSFERSDLQPKSNSPSRLRTRKMDGNLFAERMQGLALARSEDDGKRLRDHLYKIAANGEF
jgi:hypothetical protein